MSTTKGNPAKRRRGERVDFVEKSMAGGREVYVGTFSEGKLNQK